MAEDCGNHAYVILEKEGLFFASQIYLSTKNALETSTIRECFAQGFKQSEIGEGMAREPNKGLRHIMADSPSDAVEKAKKWCEKRIKKLEKEIKKFEGEIRSLRGENIMSLHVLGNGKEG